MALAKIKKIQLLASAQHKDKILDILQNTGAMNVTELSEESQVKPERILLDLDPGSPYSAGSRM